MIEINQRINRSIQEVFRDNLYIFVRDALFVDAQTKYACIYADVDKNKEEEYLYTLLTAKILSILQSHRFILGWSYVPRYSQLDGLLIDFIVIQPSGDIVGVNSTSSTREAERHRQRMRVVYPNSTGGNPAIAIVRWRDKLGCDRSADEVRTDLIRQLNFLQPLAVLS